MPRPSLKNAAGALLCALMCTVGVATAQNPDGPVGSVMLEPSLTFAGVWDYTSSGMFSTDLRSWQQALRDDDDDDLWTPLQKDFQDFDFDAQRYAIAILAPIKPAWTVGAHYAFTNTDARESTRLMRWQHNMDSWEVGFRVRYWWRAAE